MSSDMYKGFRLAVVGGCQVVGVRRWAERLLPGVTVDAWHVNAAPSFAPEVVEPQITGHDLVICQLKEGSGGGNLEFSRLAASHRNVVFLPLFVFPGFHPDLISLSTATSPPQLVQGPMSVLQSAIIAAAYHLQIPPDRVPRLFNAFVFEALGYFSVFPQARAALQKINAEDGYDLGPAVDEWLRDGVFMYTDNHPHIRVLGTLTRMALQKAGIAIADPGNSDAPPDDLANSVQWPVYPAIARRIGVPGTQSFVRTIDTFPAGEPREMALDAFVRESYRVIAAAGPLDRDGRVERTADVLKSVLGARGMSAA